MLPNFLFSLNLSTIGKANAKVLPYPVLSRAITFYIENISSKVAS